MVFKLQDNTLGIVILFFVLIVGNKLLALPQIYKLNKQLLELKKTGPISSVGLYRHWSGNKAYILITEKDGTIIQGYRMGGITIFAKFVEDKELTEKKCQAILDGLSKKEKLSHQEKAKQMAAQYLVNGLNEMTVSTIENETQLNIS